MNQICRMCVCVGFHHCIIHSQRQTEMHPSLIGHQLCLVQIGGTYVDSTGLMIPALLVVSTFQEDKNLLVADFDCEQGCQVLVAEKCKPCFRKGQILDLTL